MMSREWRQVDLGHYEGRFSRGKQKMCEVGIPPPNQQSFNRTYNLLEQGAGDRGEFTAIVAF